VGLAEARRRASELSGGTSAEPIKSFDPQRARAARARRRRRHRAAAAADRELQLASGRRARAAQESGLQEDPAVQLVDASTAELLLGQRAERAAEVCDDTVDVNPEPEHLQNGGNGG
jgi:hypothetical protein